jgi:hypothetical protein
MRRLVCSIANCYRRPVKNIRGEPDEPAIPLCETHADRYRRGKRGTDLSAPVRAWGGNGAERFWSVSIGFTHLMLDLLRDMAKTRQMSLADCVREAVGDWLNNPLTVVKLLPEERRAAFLESIAVAFRPKTP